MHKNESSKLKVLIIRSFSSSGLSLVVVDISSNDLSSVNQHDMAKAVRNMEKIDLRRTSLTNEQCSQIFKYAEDDSNMKVLSIGGRNDLRSVEPGSIAKTVSKMEECDLRYSKLSSQQLEEILKHLKEDCKLKKPFMSGVNLSSVEGNVISKAIANLEEVDLSGTHLKNLYLRCEDLRSLHINSLVGALSCLEILDVSLALLTPEQVAASKSIPRDCKLKGLED